MFAHAEANFACDWDFVELSCEFRIGVQEPRKFHFGAESRRVGHIHARTHALARLLGSQ